MMFIHMDIDKIFDNNKDEYMENEFTKLSDDAVREVSDKICDSMRDSITDWMLSACKDDLKQYAENWAEEYIQKALAGDDKVIRNLFGFNYLYGNSLQIHKPHQWELVDALLERNPKLFEMEKITQLREETRHLEGEIVRLKEYHKRIVDDLER